MAGVDPFWLYDKVDPHDDNDPEEVIKAADAADDLTGRRKPERTINRLDEREAFDSIRDYQKKRNLKVDGVLNPNGPTAQRMSAEKHALADRKNPPAFSTLLGRGSRAPLWGSVGRGGQNLKRDVRVAQNALALAGHKVSAPDPEPGSSEDKAGGEAVVPALTRFQRQHGLKPDGAMEAFGATHMMIDSILAPKIEALAGRDPENPKPFEPREPKVVGKIKKSRPTTILSSFQDEENLPSRADHAAATELLSAIGEDVAFETKARAREAAEKAAETGQLGSDKAAAAPSDSNDTAITAGGGRHDILDGGAGDDKLDGEKGEAPANGDEATVSAAEARIALLAPHLTPRQIAEAARQADETGADEASDGQLRRYANRVASTVPDHAADLRRQIESGEKTTADLEHRLEVLIANRVTQMGNEERRQRIAGTIEVLAEQYMADAAGRGIAMDRGEAMALVRKLQEAVTADKPVDIELLGDILWTAIDFVPVIGEAKSAYEAIGLYQQILEAQAAEPPKDTTELYAQFSLAMLGAVPFLGKGVKAINLGGRVKDALEKGKAAAKSTKLYRKLDEQVAGHQLLGMTDKGRLDAISAQSLFDAKTWAKFDVDTRSAFELSLRVAKKRGSEARLRGILERSALDVPIERDRLVRYDVEVSPGVWKERHYDGVAMGKLTKRLGGLIVGKSDDRKTWVYEMKVDGSDLTPRQREIDEAVIVHDKKRVGRKAKKAKGDLPAFEDDIQYLRMPMYTLPKEELLRNVRGVLRGKQVPDAAIQELEARIDAGYETAKALRRAGRIDLAAKITLGTVTGVSIVGLTQLE